MRHAARYAIPLGLCLALSPPLPTLAQSQSDGLGLIQEGTRQLLDDLMGALEPGLQRLREGLGEMAPLLQDLSKLMLDLENYEAPETLPNGDILIRRKPEAKGIEI